MIIFDIGAGLGGYGITMAKDSTQNTVYSFEPVESTYQNLLLRTQNLENLKIFANAIDNSETNRTLYICGSNSFRFSSLLKISDIALNHWPGISDLDLIDTVRIKTIKLSSFVKDNNINRIDHLHINSNGNDLNILKSLENYIDILFSGSIIGSIIEDVLYVGQNTINESIEHIKNVGFKITNIKLNDNFGNQAQIDFIR